MAREVKIAIITKLGGFAYKQTQESTQ